MLEQDKDHFKDKRSEKLHNSRTTIVPDYLVYIWNKSEVFFRLVSPNSLSFSV